MEHDNTIYHQVEGVVMGQAFSVMIANIFMYKIVGATSAGAVQKGRKNKGCNAVERTTSTVRCGRGVAPLPGLQQSASAG